MMAGRSPESLDSICFLCTAKCEYKFSVGENGKLIKLTGDADNYHITGNDRDNSISGEHDLTVDFIVDNLLKIPNIKWKDQVDLQNGHGSNAFRLLAICDSCESIIQRCYERQLQINQLTNQLENGRQELMEQMFMSCPCPSPNLDDEDDDLIGNSFWISVREQVFSSCNSLELPRNSDTQSQVNIDPPFTADDEDSNSVISASSGSLLLTCSSRSNLETQNVLPPRSPSVDDEAVTFSPPRTHSVHVKDLRLSPLTQNDARYLRENESNASLPRRPSLQSTTVSNRLRPRSHPSTAPISTKRKFRQSQNPNTVELPKRKGYLDVQSQVNINPPLTAEDGRSSLLLKPVSSATSSSLLLSCSPRLNPEIHNISPLCTPSIDDEAASFSSASTKKANFKVSTKRYDQAELTDSDDVVTFAAPNESTPADMTISEDSDDDDDEDGEDQTPIPAKRKSQSQMQSHYKSAHTPPGGAKLGCGKAYNLTTTPARNSLTCQDCGKEFEHRKSLVKHVKYYSLQEEFSCKICHKTFKLKHHVSRHMKSFHNIDSVGTVANSTLTTSVENADECGDPIIDDTEKCSTASQFNSYNDDNGQQNQDIGFSEPTSSATPVQNEYLPTSKLSQDRSGNSMFTITLFPNGKPCFTCLSCKTEFSSRSKLKAHLQYHKRTRKYRCDVCFCEFKFKYDLTVHKEVHNANRIRHACTVCPKTFAWKKDLLKHMRTKHDTTSISTEFTGIGEG